MPTQQVMDAAGSLRRLNEVRNFGSNLHHGMRTRASANLIRKGRTIVKDFLLSDIVPDGEKHLFPSAIPSFSVA